MITEHYTCPSCGYLSRVVAGLKCPSCGYLGEWKVDIYAPDIPFCGLEAIERLIWEAYEYGRPEDQELVKEISDISEGKKRMKKPSLDKTKVRENK